MNFNRILVIRSSGALGDIVCSLPVLGALRRAYPGSHIRVVGNPSLLEIARSYADVVSPLPEGFWTLFSKDAAVPADLGRSLGSFDLIVAFAGPDEPLVRRLSSFCSETVAVAPIPPEGTHACDWYLAALAPLGVRGSSIPRVEVPAAAEEEAAMLWREHGLDAFPSVVCCAPGSGSPAKNWGRRRFEKAVRMLVEEVPSGIVEVEGPAEGWEGAPSAGRGVPGRMILRNPAVPLLAATLRRCSVYIGNDSGVTHLAAAVGVPAVALFGPTDPSGWGPRGDRVAVIASPVRCAPCTDDERRSCRDRQCLAQIGVTEVVAVARTLRTAVLCEALS